MAIPNEERQRIIWVAQRHGIDPRFLAALRETENGAPGREFGVLIHGETSWEQQASDAARTIRHTVGRYWQNVRLDPWDETTGRYGAMFLRYFSRGGEGYSGYAPLAVDNDPTGLNANHYKNLSVFYDTECA